MTIVAEDSRELVIGLHGDCCSSSFFDDDAKMDIQDCLGETLTSIACENSDGKDRTEYPESDCESYYYLEVTTNKHQFRIPFRNDSNGYYGGWAEWDKEVLKQ